MRSLALLLVCLIALSSVPASAQTPAGSAFTYQGQLVLSNVTVNGDADFVFRLYDAPAGGTLIGSAVYLYEVAVERSVFTVDLDFGAGAFDGNARYLEIRVRTPSGPPGGGDPYTTLAPRQELTPVPYALNALNALGGGSGVWQQVGQAITNTNGGFVGINGSNPLTSAEVFGVRSPVTTSYGGMYMSTAGPDALPFYGYDAGGTRAWTYLHGPTDGWRLFNGGDRLTVLSDGNVGIGTVNPLAKLEVAGLVHSTVGGFKFPDGSVQTTASGGAGGADSDWTIDGNGDMYNDTADQVSIGTSTPSSGAKLTVGGGNLGYTISEVTGSLAAELQMRGGPATFDLLTAVDETRMNSGSGQDLTVTAGRDLFLKAADDLRTYTDGELRSGIDAQGIHNFYNLSNLSTVSIDAQDSLHGGGYIALRKGNGTRSVEIFGAGNGGSQSGMVALYTDTNPNTATVVLDGEYGGTAGGALLLRNSSGQNGIELVSDLTPHEQPEIRMFKPSGQRTVEIEAEESGAVTEGATIKLYDDAGNMTIKLDADYGAASEGRIITQVLEITGGSDLSEQFDVFSDESQSIEPGSVVVIDPRSPGDLCLSSRAYDRRVAGVISGGGGVKTGMLMGQRGSEADGQHPVALTGRVYCNVDASYGAIEPGDLLTTSSTPGYAMKVSDPARATGAILGKAMTALETGKGMVLLLVSLQ